MSRIVFQTVDGRAAAPAIQLPPGRRRLSEISRWHGDSTRPFLISVHHRQDPLAVNDQTVRLRRNWSRTKVGRKQVVVITYLPRGGGSSSRGGGSSNKGATIGLLVATVALAAIGQFWAIGAIGSALMVSSAVASTIWAAGSAVVLAGGAYLLSRATQAKANKTDDRPIYGVSGGGNLPRSGDRIPSVYGRTWTAPDLSQPDYTTNEGDDQVLFKRMTLGLGRYEVKTIRVANAIMWTAAGGVQAPFNGAEIDVVNPGETSDLVPSSVLSVAAVNGNQIPKPGDNPPYVGPFDFGVSGGQQTRIQLDYSLPQGVFAIPTNGKFEGKQYPVQWGVRFEYATSDENGNPTGPWQELHSDGAYVMLTRAQRFTVFKDVPTGRYTFRAQNTGAPDEVSTNPQIPQFGINAKNTNTVSWDALRSHLPEAIVRPDVTEIAMRIRSGKALGVTAFGNIEVEIQRILPVWTGSAWVEQPTRKAVWAFADILRNESYGAGLSDGQIDRAGMLHYASSLDEYDTYDGTIRGPVSVYEAASTVLGVMRASPLRLGNVWSLARDEQKLLRRHVVSRRQILRDSTGEVFNLDLSDGSADVIVEWNADGDPRRRREHRVTFGTVTNVPRRLQAEGITTAEHAIHIATWAAASAFYRRIRRSVSVELSGRLIAPNDGALIDNWFFDAYQTAGILERSGLTLEIDTEIGVLPPNPYVVLRGRDGREWGPVAFTSPDPFTLVLNGEDVGFAEAQTGLSLAQVIATATQAFSSVVIGSYSEVRDSWLVRSLKFSGSSKVDIEAVEDAPEVWAALGEPIIAPPPPPSLPEDESEAIRIAWVRAKAVQRGTSVMMEWAVGQARIPADYVVQISYDDWATWEDVYRGPASSGSYPIRDTDGVIKVRAWAVSQNGIMSPLVTTQFQAVRAVISGQTGVVRIDYDDLVAGIRFRTQQLPDIEPVFASVLEGMVDAFQGRQLAETGIIKTEQVKQDLTQQLVSISTEIRAQLDSGFASAFQQIGVLQTETLSLATSYQSLSAQLTTGFAGFDQRIAALVLQDVAFAGSLTTFSARLGSAESGLSQEVATRSNQYSALSQEITSLTASFNGNVVSTSQALQALVSNDQAIAQQVDQVSARLGNLFAEGRIQFAAVAAPAGVFARFAIVLKASVDGAPFETGLYMELIQQGGTFYSQVFIDTNRFVLGNPNTRSIPFSVVDGVTYIDEAVIRSGTISRHASADSGGRNTAVGLPVRVGSRVNVIGVYQGGQSGVNGGGTNMRIRRNGNDIKVVPVSYTSYSVNSGGSLAYYNCTVVMASYDVGYNGTDVIEVVTDQAPVLGGGMNLNGVSLQAVCFNK